MIQGRALLKAWLDRSEWTQKQLAEALQVSEVFISNLLSGDRLPGRDMIFAIEDVTGVPARSWRQTDLNSVVADNRKHKSQTA